MENVYIDFYTTKYSAPLTVLVEKQGILVVKVKVLYFIRKEQVQYIPHSLGGAIALARVGRVTTEILPEPPTRYSG